MIVCVTTTGDVARGLARHRPNVPVLAFCFDAAVARQLQLHRAIHPVLLTRAEDHTPLSIVDSANVRMGLLRTEAIRVGREMRWVSATSIRITQISHVCGVESTPLDAMYDCFELALAFA